MEDKDKEGRERDQNTPFLDLPSVLFDTTLSERPAHALASPSPDPIASSRSPKGTEVEEGEEEGAVESLYFTHNL